MSEENKKQYSDFQKKALATSGLSDLLKHSSNVGEDREDQMFLLRQLLDIAVSLEFATIPIYLQAMWSIRDNEHEVAKSIRNIFQEEMLHMAMVCNMVVGIGGEPKIYDAENGLKFPTGLPGGVHPSLFLFLEGLNNRSLRNFLEIELPDEIATIYDHQTNEVVDIGGLYDSEGNQTSPTYDPDHSHNKTIGALYDQVEELFKKLRPEMDVERQLAGPLSWWVMADVWSVSKAIDMIKEQGEGAQDVSPESTGMDNLAHFYRFWEVYYEKKIIKDGDTYFFKDPLRRPETINVAPIPEGGYNEEDVSPEVWFLIHEFDKTYTQLVKYLHDAWAVDGAGQAALVHAIEVMFKLEKYALPLMEIPIPGDPEGRHYGPCFRIL